MTHSTQSRNYWSDSKCARVFRNQHELPPYQELLADTIAWLMPQPGQRWLDLGCGSGQLSKALWQQSRGQIAQVIGIDCAGVNHRAYQKLRATLTPTPSWHQCHFVRGDMATALSVLDSGSFDGIVSGLAIQYAESYSESEQRWTTAGYDAVLAGARRVLKPGGQFLFSVNVPNPSWSKAALSVLRGTVSAARPLSYLKKAYRIWSYGSWLHREAQSGRFNYLPLPVIQHKLNAAGFHAIDHRTSFAGQAYLIRCHKPTLAQVA